MQLIQTDRQLEIHLNWGEQFLAFHFGRVITIPFNTIATVSTQQPTWSWRTLRAPGTSIPGVINAGTFYTEYGREFWFISRNRDYLVITLQSGYYKKIILTTSHNYYWKEILTTLVQGQHYAN